MKISQKNYNLIIAKIRNKVALTPEEKVMRNDIVENPQDHEHLWKKE